MSQASEAPAAVEGSCACGKIRYTASKMPTSSTNCHCRICQKVAGAPYMTWTAIEKASVQWSSLPDLWKFSKIADRGHCSQCGSSMTMQYHLQPARLSIAASTIDKSTAPVPQPEEHIFLNEKASWFQMPDDGLSRFDEFDPSFQDKLNRWKKAQCL